MGLKGTAATKPVLLCLISREAVSNREGQKGFYFRMHSFFCGADRQK
jgi:hypothetical protein